MTTDALSGRPAYGPSLSHLADAEFQSKGWRSFFSYRDLGVKEATGGDFNVRVVRTGEGEHTSTGWHHHQLSIQIVYCIGGWEVIALEDGRMAKLVPGSCLQIPSGFAHNEVGYAPDMEMFVLSGPDPATTVPVDPPVGWDDVVLEQIPGQLAHERQTAPWFWK